MENLQKMAVKLLQTLRFDKLTNRFRVTDLLHINTRQGLEGPAAGGLRQQWSGLGTRGTPESPLKMASLPFLRTGLCKHLTRPPWRYMFCGNGKGVAMGLFLEIGAAAG